MNCCPDCAAPRDIRTVPKEAGVCTVCGQPTTALYIPRELDLFGQPAR